MLSLMSLERPTARQVEHFRDLVFETVRAELKARNFRSVLGTAWWLLDPLLMALLYFFITTVMFSYGGGRDFLLYIVIATVSWRWFSRCLDNGPMLITSYKGVLKQTNFPAFAVLAIFAVTELTFFLFGLAVVEAVLLCCGVMPGASLVWLPLIVLVQLMLSLGLMTILAVIGVFLRDVGHVTYLFTAVWFYLSPGIYPASRIPPGLRWLYAFNPFATIFPAYESVLLRGRAPDVAALLAWLAAGTILFCLSIRFFHEQRMKFYKLL